jgi:hypothetical protein
MPKSFRTELQEIWDTISESRKDQHFSMVEFLLITAELAEGVATLCRETVGSDEDFKSLVADTEWLVSTYVVPIKILPNRFLEAMLDAQLVPMVRPTLEAMRHNILNGTPAA